MSDIDYRYVGHVDMLGMSELTIRNPDLAWDALSKLNQAKEEILRLRIGLISSREMIADRVHSFTFSDTILLFSRSDEEADTYAMVILCSELFFRALHYSIPLRAGISHGRFLFNTDHNLFAGPPLVASYHLSEGAQWLGVCLDSIVAERARAIPLESPRGRPVVVDWPVPHKGLPVEPYPVIDWIETHRGNFIVQPPLSVAQFYQAFEQLFGPFADLPAAVQAKYKNTTDFVNERYLD